MQYNNSSDRDEIQEKPLDDYFDGSEHSHFKRNGLGRSSNKRFSKGDMPLIIIGAAVLILIVFLISIALKSGSPEGDIRITDMENRLKKMEEQFQQLGNVQEQMNLIELQDKKMAQLIDRVGQLESEQDLKWTQTEKKSEPSKPKAKVEVVQKPEAAVPNVETETSQQPIAPKPKVKAAAPQKPVVAKKTVPVRKTAVVAPKNTQDMHQVQTGETVFSIAKRYGLKVAALQQMNPSMKGNDIFPGQKLKVSAR